MQDDTPRFLHATVNDNITVAAVESWNLYRLYHLIRPVQIAYNW